MVIVRRLPSKNDGAQVKNDEAQITSGIPKGYQRNTRRTPEKCQDYFIPAMQKERSSKDTKATSQGHQKNASAYIRPLIVYIIVRLPCKNSGAQATPQKDGRAYIRPLNNANCLRLPRKGSGTQGTQKRRQRDINFHNPTSVM